MLWNIYPYNAKLRQVLKIGQAFQKTETGNKRHCTKVLVEINIWDGKKNNKKVEFLCKIQNNPLFCLFLLELKVLLVKFHLIWNHLDLVSLVYIMSFFSECSRIWWVCLPLAGWFSLGGTKSNFESKVD